MKRKQPDEEEEKKEEKFREKEYDDNEPKQGAFWLANEGLKGNSLSSARRRPSPQFRCLGV
jgi:hypothetical protein